MEVLDEHKQASCYELASTVLKQYWCSIEVHY
jgi:hypothetical protein